jgi:DNA-binding CsgD family transcriptional regulator
LVEDALLAVASDGGMTPVHTTRLLEAARGLSYRQIADLHGVSLNTVKTEMKSVLGSLRASCCHEIRDASMAAKARVRAGASEDEITEFIRLRFE